MRLFIAEKPSLGRAIADGLGNGQRQQGCIVCGDDTVTWCFGHLLEQCPPESYNPEWRHWQREALPMIPPEWKLIPRKDAEEQLAIIKRLLQQATSVVNAGDPDREGQLLVDEVLERFAYQGPVKRIWLASLDDRSVQKALSSLTDNSRYAPLRDAARARSQADWLVGLNATRAMTLKGKEAGHDGVLSLGRVQTPTLNLVVARDREIAAFKPIDFFVLQASLTHPAGGFTATFVPGDMQPGLDAQGRLVDPAVVASLASALRDAQGVIAQVTREKKQVSPPLPHCLSSLQKAASAKLGMTAQAVLDTAQKLYEQKLTTYPRSDCRYLPVEQFDEVPHILVALNKLPELEGAASHADSSLRGPVWDTKKVTAHHAIIPTGEDASKLTGKERALYLMIATVYCLQFYPPQRYEAQKITVDLHPTSQNRCQTRWEARGRLTLDAGWTRCVRDEDGKADQSLPAVSQGDAVRCADVATLKKKTTPPERWTEGTLIEAMANIHRFVTDAGAKATLKDNEGLGTEATRAGILESLKKRGYLATSGRALLSTPLAGMVIALTPPVLKDPVTTAQWESRLDDIAHGRLTLKTFMEHQVQVLPTLLAPLLADGGTSLPRIAPEHPCPACGRSLYRRTGASGPFWACRGYPDCTTTLPDDNGKPGKKKPQNPGKETDYACPACGKPLKLYRQKSKKTGKPFDVYNCSGYPVCKQSFFGKNGKPDFSGNK